MGVKGPEPADGGLPRIHDEQPPPMTGVPVERDPVSGKLLTGGPGGRGDKGGTAGRPRRLPLLVAAAVVLVAGGTTAVVAVATTSDDTPVAADRSGAAEPPGGEGEDESEGDDPGGDPGDQADRRPVDMEFTVTAIRTPPGQEGRYGTVGERSEAVWLLTGPCDGDGPCTVEHCITETACTFDFTLEPAGAGYAGQFEFSWFDRPWPECGAVRVDVQVTVDQGADGPAYSGTYTQDHGAPLGPDGNGSYCNIPLTDSSFRSV